MRVPVLPLEFFNAESLNKIGGLLGKTLKVDAVTYLAERGRYARICVELDLRKKLHSAVRIFGKERHVEYEGLHLICFKCGKYGHHRDSCIEINIQKSEGNDTKKASTSGVKNIDGEDKGNEKRGREVWRAAESEAEGPSEKNNIGAWNLVRRPVRKQLTIPKNGRSGENQGGNFGRINHVDMIGQEKRMDIKIGVNNGDIPMAKFDPGQSFRGRNFRKEISNEKKWVPVSKPRRRIIVGQKKIQGNNSTESQLTSHK